MNLSDRASRPQTTLRALFALTTTVAVGVAVARSDHFGWTDALVAIVCLAIVVGLLHQAYDIHRALRNWEVNQSAARLAWRIACVWRMMVVALILVCWIVSVLDAVGVIALPSLTSSEEVYLDITTSTLQFVALSLLVVISLSASLVGAKPPSTFTGWQRRIDRLGHFAGVILGCLVLMWACAIPALVHLAIRGVVLNYPNRFFGDSDYVLDAAAYGKLARLAQFASYGSFALSIIGAACAAWAVGRTWKRVSSRLCVWFIWALSTGLALSIAFWIHTQAFPTLSPFLFYSSSAATELGIVSTWIICAGLFVPAATWRLHCRRSSDGELPALHWYTPKRGYIHEHRIVFLLLLISQLGAMDRLRIRDFVELLEDASGLGAMTVALMWLSFSGLVARRRPDRIRAMEELAPVSVLGLAFALGAIALSLAALVESARWANFMFWIQP
jgi:hypothetical protein